jgi:glutamate racemase
MTEPTPDHPTPTPSTPPTSALAVGVFDSGVGGLTVLRALRAALPCERLIYLGDTARVPYGNKGPDTVRRYALGCANFLAAQGIKALVLACNTASAYGEDAVRDALPIPVVSVIEPVSALAVRQTQTGVIAVLGTRGTVGSQAYLRAITRHKPDIQVIQQACPLFVPLAEEGWCDGEVPERIAERYLAPIAATNADTIILGCTHYPLLRRTIEVVLRRLMPHPITVLDSAATTAQQLRHILDSQSLRRSDDPVAPRYLVTDDPSRFSSTGELFMGHALGPVEHIDLKI